MYTKILAKAYNLIYEKPIIPFIMCNERYNEPGAYFNTGWTLDKPSQLKNLVISSVDNTEA